MPWKRIGKCVFKTTKSGKKKEKQGCSDSVPKAKEYLKALYANAGDVSEQVDDYLREVALSEAKIKDIKAKYPTWDESGFIDIARGELEDKIGTKAPSKYLMYIMNSLEFMFEHTDAYDLEDMKEDIRTVLDDLVGLITAFEENIGRIKEKDIYKYSLPQLEKLINDLGVSSSKEKSELADQAREDSELVYDDNRILAYRPLTEAASCHWGKGTRWCISATESENWFDKYTGDRLAFVMIMFRNAKNVNENLRKLTLVYDEYGDLREMYDIPDKRYYSKQIKDYTTFAIAQNLYGIKNFEEYETLRLVQQEKTIEIYNDIVESGSEVIQDNPPDPSQTFEAKLDALDEEYSSRIKNGYFGSQLEDGYVSYWGGFSIPLDDDRFIKDLPNGWRELGELASEIQQMLDQEISVYGEVDLDNDYVRIDISSGDYETNPDGYESYLNDLESLDEKYNAMIRVVDLVLQREGYYKKSSFDEFDVDIINKQLKNFSAVDRRKYVADEDIVIESSLEELGVKVSRPQLSELGFEKVDIDMYYNDSLNNRVLDKLNTLNQKIVSALKQQLPLPGIPQKQIKELTIPEMLKVFIDNERETNDNDFFLRLTIDDVKITKESLNTIVEIFKFLDENYDEIVNIARNAIKVYLVQGIRAKDIERKEKETAAKLNQADAEGDSEAVNEVNEYFEELLKTELDRRIEKMTIEEWLDPDMPAPWDKDYEDKK